MQTCKGLHQEVALYICKRTAETFHRRRSKCEKHGGFLMNKRLSCRYNMDTNRVEAWFEGGIPLPSTALPWRTNTATPRHSGQNWTGCSTTSPWSMPSLCWVGRLDIISRLVATMAGWKINDITNTAPLWRRRSQSGAVFNEGEMKEISDYRSSSNCSTVTVALPSAAKVMPSADCGV